MKFMHLNSSCSYAGLANMLMLQGHDTEDYQIALDIDLASHIRYEKESDTFLSGFSLQSKKWFDLYLKSRGFIYVEKFFSKDEIIKNLKPGMMLGIYVTPERKHAVICYGNDNGIITFINNKWEHSDEPEMITLTQAELFECITETVGVGYIMTFDIENVDLKGDYIESLQTWELLRDKLHEFMCESHSVEMIRSKLDTLFRPLLLDGLTMAKLRNDEDLVAKLTTLQGSFLGILKQNVPARLSDFIDMTLLDRAIDIIIEHVKAELIKL